MQKSFPNIDIPPNHRKYLIFFCNCLCTCFFYSLFSSSSSSSSSPSLHKAQRPLRRQRHLGRCRRCRNSPSPLRLRFHHQMNCTQPPRSLSPRLSWPSSPPKVESPLFMHMQQRKMGLVKNILGEQNTFIFALRYFAGTIAMYTTTDCF